jgi:hypothetical protein
MHHSLWFAAYAWGWELVPWPADLADACPPQLVCEPEHGRPVALTVVDARCVHRLPQATLNAIENPVLWIDATEGRAPAVSRPLDLCHLLPFLDPDPERSASGITQADRVKVLVADPFKLFRQALVRCFEDREDVLVVGAVDSPDAYRRALETAAFDVAVVASDFLEGTRTSRELQPGDSLLAGQGARDSHSEAADVPLVVLLADEDLQEAEPTVATQVPPVWVPGGFVEGKRVSIPRGAPVEVLVQAISLLAEKKGGAQPPRESEPFFEQQQPQSWS